MKVMLDFSRFEWISFDCYGTLVDWETGIAAAVGKVLESHGIHRSEAEILALYADAEPRVQASSGLHGVPTRLARGYGADRD